MLPALSLRIGLGEDAHWETTKKGKKIRRATKPPKNFESFHNGTTVYYQKPEQNEKGSWKAIEQYSDEPGKYKNYGYLLKWGMGVAKLHYHVFAVQKNKPAISELKVSRDIVERKMFPVLESYLDQPALTPGNTLLPSHSKIFSDHLHILRRQPYYVVSMQADPDKTSIRR